MHLRESIFVFLTITASGAIAGTIRFEPPVTLVRVDSGQTMVHVEVWLDVDAGVFDNLTAIIGSDDGLVVNMVYSERFFGETAFRTETHPPVRVGVFASDILIGGYLTAPQHTPYYLGHLTLELPAPLEVGTYAFGVDPAQYFCFAGVCTFYPETMQGEGRIEVVAAPAVTLVSADPPHNGTLSQMRRNKVILTFSDPLPGLPGAGEITIRELLPEGSFGPDIASQFAFTIDGARLVIHDVLVPFSSPGSLKDRKWYAINSMGDWAGVEDFCVDYLVRFGDADGNGFVNFADVANVNVFLVQPINDSNRRRNIDGNAAINFVDMAVANTFITPNALSLPKPSGHPSVCMP